MLDTLDQNTRELAAHTAKFRAVNDALERFLIGAGATQQTARARERRVRPRRFPA